jgi:hypothetical protein
MGQKTFFSLLRAIRSFLNRLKNFTIFILTERRKFYMIINKNNILMCFPEMKLVNRQGNLFIENLTYEEARQLLNPYLAPVPSDLITTKYKEKVYRNKEVYLINDRYYSLKKSKRDGKAYLFDF